MPARPGLRAPAAAVRLPALIALLLAAPAPAVALCVAPAMEGRWANVQPSGALKSLELRFKCCDQVRCPAGQPCVTVCTPPENAIKAVGPCATGVCSWGEVAPHYLFEDAAAGFQVTRVDARFTAEGEVRELVILLLPDDRLLVHWSVRYPAGSGAKDFSFVEYFERARCVTLRSGAVVCLERAERATPPAYEKLPRVLPK